MEIYGLGLVGVCMFIGSTVGTLIGKLVNSLVPSVEITGDIGGVGFSMLLLILVTNYLEKSGKPLSEKTGKGILLLSALYIPIVVAMSANQNLYSAFSSGLVAFAAGIVATVGGLLLVPVISKLGKK